MGWLAKTDMADNAAVSRALSFIGELHRSSKMCVYAVRVTYSTRLGGNLRSEFHSILR